MRGWGEGRGVKGGVGCAGEVFISVFQAVCVYPAQILNQTTITFSSLMFIWKVLHWFDLFDDPTSIEEQEDI